MVSLLSIYSIGLSFSSLRLDGHLSFGPDSLLPQFVSLDQGQGQIWIAIELIATFVVVVTQVGVEVQRIAWNFVQSRRLVLATDTHAFLLLFNSLSGISTAGFISLSGGVLIWLLQELILDLVFLLLTFLYRAFL